MNYPAMIRHIAAFAIVVALIILAGCASPRNASITNGNISNLTSAEATTLVKQSNRTTRANNVMQNSPPIFQMKAQPGQKIEISGVESITVNVPIDPALLMADQPDVTSENVQMFREGVNGIGAATPLVLGGMALSDRKDARAAGLEESRIRSAERAAQNAAQADLVNRVLNKDPLILIGTDIQRLD